MHIFCAFSFVIALVLHHFSAIQFLRTEWVSEVYRSIPLLFHQFNAYQQFSIKPCDLSTLFVSHSSESLNLL